MSDTDLKEKEEAGAHDSLGVHPERAEAEAAELDKLFANSPDSGGGLFKARKSSGRSRFKLTRKQVGAGGGMVGILIGGTFGVLTIVQGPLQIVHFSKLLDRFHFLDDQEFMDGRAGKLIQYARTRNEPQRRNLTYFGNKLADNYETKLREKGMTPVYEGGRTGRMNGIDVDPKTAEGRKVLADMEARGLTDFSPQPDGRVRIDLSGTNAATRRMAINGMIDSLGINKMSSAIATRQLKTRAQVDFHPLKNVARSADEKLFDYVKRRQAERDNTIANGATDTPNDVTSGGSDPDEDTTNNPPDAGAEANAIIDELPDGDASVSQIDNAASSFKSKLNRGSGALGAVALVCGLYQLGKSIPDLKHANLVLPLIRMGIEIAAMGSQAMTGQLNMDELGARTRNLNQAAREIEEADGSRRMVPGSSWAGARSIQAENGQPATGPDMPAGAKPNTESPLFFEALTNGINAVPGAGTACGAVTSTVGGWAIDIFSWASNAGGPATIVLNVVTDLATGALVGSFMDDAVRWLVGAPLALDASGALLGNYANYGARLAANDAAISHGGMALSNSQSAALDQERAELLKTRLRSESMFARYLDINEPDSLVAKAAFSPTVAKISSPSGLISTILSQPFSIFSSLTSAFQPKVSAASTYDYGFPQFGFSPEERDATENDDPLAIASRVEPNLASLNDKYGKCFNMTVQPDTFQLRTTNDAFRYDRMNDPGYEECTNSNNRELTEFRFYLADLTTAKAMACYEGIDESACSELGMGATAAPAATATPVPGNLTCPADLNTSLVSPNGAKTIYQLKQPAGNEYIVRGGAPQQQYGIRELLCVLHTAGLNYNAKMGGTSKLEVWDLAAGAPHVSHLFTVGVDLRASGAKVGGDHSNDGGRYDTTATIELGKAFVDTGLIRNIWWCDPGDGSTEQIRAYAQSVGKPIDIHCIDGHANHFHVDINGARNPIYCPPGDTFGKTYTTANDGFSARDGEACDGWR